VETCAGVETLPLSSCAVAVTALVFGLASQAGRLRERLDGLLFRPLALGLPDLGGLPADALVVLRISPNFTGAFAGSAAALANLAEVFPYGFGTHTSNSIKGTRSLWCHTAGFSWVSGAVATGSARSEVASGNLAQSIFYIGCRRPKSAALITG
jgi:hypothetical protein